MNESIIFNVDKKNNIIIPDNICSDLKNLFSGCNVNFLLGAGFSANLLGTLKNDENIFEALQAYPAKNKQMQDIKDILLSYLYWKFFLNCIKPIINIDQNKFEPYKDFGDILYKIFSERANPLLDRQFNIFTTNYDPIIELIFDQSNCICNDGFEGRIYPIFSTDNYTKIYYRKAIFSNRKAEIPSLNLIKIHGSITWKQNIQNKNLIEYQNYNIAIEQFFNRYNASFDKEISDKINKILLEENTTSKEKIEKLLQDSSIWAENLIGSHPSQTFINDYKNSFIIVNPTKEKFRDTVQNKNYYELLRIFSNELEKENSLLIVNGFSFRDEHLTDLIKRSMVNPSLKLLIFSFTKENIAGFKAILETSKYNNNISYIALEDNNLDLNYFNKILSTIHL